jgi:hypothetical protein
MNPYRLKNVYDYLTSNNQLLKKKLKLGTDDIPIPPKRDDVTTIEAINRFNKANPRVDTTNLKPLSVKHSNVRQSNVNEPNEGMIQGAYDTATREAQSEGFPAPSYDKFKSRYLKKNMKADGGRMGYKDGLGPSNQPMGPVYTTNKIEDAAKEVVKRLIKLDGVDIPLTDKISMSLGPGLNRTEIRGVIDILGGELNIGGGMKGDDKGIGFTFRKEFQDGGMLVQPSDDGSRPGYAKDKAPIGSEIRKINKKTSPYYGKWAYRVVENGERVTKYSDIKPKSPDTSPKHPYVNSKDFKNFLEEYKITNPDWTPKKGYAAILDKYERGLARKNKIVGVPELVEVLGEKSPYTEQTLINIFAKTQKKITKNMSKKEKADIKNAKRLYKVFEDTIGAPSKFSDTLNEYNYIRQFPSEKRYQSAWDYNPSKIKKLNKALNKYYNQVGDLQTSTIDNIFKFLDNKNLIAEIKNYKGGSISQDSPIFTNLLKEYKGGKDPSYAFMQLGRALRGEIQIDGIEKNLKLGNRIIKLTADNYRGPLGNSFLEWAKLQMAKDFDDPSNTYKSLTTKIRNSMKSIGITDLSGLAIDEIFPARTGQLTLKGSGAYNQIIQFIDGEINSKAKAAFDGRSSTRYQQIVDNIKNKNFDKVQEIVNNHNLDINSFYEKYPQAKGKVKLTKLNYDSANKRFLSPTEIYGADVLPSKILKGMEKFYAKTGLSLDVGSTTTLEKAAAELSGDTKTQAKLLRKMGFKCKFAGKKGGLGSCDDPASYIDDINKTKADVNSNDPTVRNKAIVKNRKALEIAKTIPKIGKLVQKAAQVGASIITTPLKALGLTSPVGIAIEGAVEGGIYDYYRAQGYNHDQAYAETFTPKISNRCFRYYRHRCRLF